MPLISVIIPAYNAEKYLVNCVRSIQTNNFQNFEILLIDDGSTDQTGPICDGLSEKDNRIRVVHTVNQGVSRARNAGLEAMRGELVCFVDSDDIVSPDMLQTLLEAMTPDTQLSVGRAQRLREQEALPEAGQIPAPYSCDLPKSAFQVFAGPFTCQVCGKLFRTELIRSHHLCFPKDCTVIEDVYFLSSYLAVCKRAAFVDFPFYYYIMHDGSIMNTFRSSNSIKGAYVNLPRAWVYCAAKMAASAPGIVPLCVARADMFYQTVLRKLRSPSAEFIQEVQAYLKQNGSVLLQFPWGKKYFLSGLMLRLSYPLWAMIFRRGSF